LSGWNVAADMRRWTTSLGVLCFSALPCLTLFNSAALGGESVPVPVNLQVPVFLKILTFDRNFDQKKSSQLKIGVIYVEEDAASRRAKDDIAKILGTYTEKTIKSLPITYMPMHYTSEWDLDETAKSQGVNVFYITPGNAKNLASLLRISRKQRITTITCVPDYVKDGVTVGLGLKNDNKMQILINLRSARQEGVAFDANLLRLSTVVRR